MKEKYLGHRKKELKLLFSKKGRAEDIVMRLIEGKALISEGVLVIRRGDTAFFDQACFRSIFQQHAKLDYARNKIVGKKGSIVEAEVVAHIKESKFQNFLFWNRWTF